MSSSMNNNLPIQNIATSPNSTEFASSRQGSSSVAGARRSQRAQHDQASISRRGRAGRPNRGRGPQSGLSNRTDNSVMSRGIGKESQDDVAAENLTQTSSELAQTNTETSSNVAGRVRGSKNTGPRNGTGKHRQRLQANQLIDGMASSYIGCLDIDLAERLVPTSSGGRQAELEKGRHATNNRKLNMAHLVNTEYGRQRRSMKHQPSFVPSDTGSQHRLCGSRYRDPGTIHKFSKQQFLQANCQFVMLAGYDYSVHRVDPDWPVEWNYIEEVRFKQSASTETTCPICLEPPVAAKITRCGHIYCWACILHYLSLSDENCRQCPICFEPVYKSDLRSVVSHFFTNYSVGDEITMKLMIRKKGCVEVEPYSVGNLSSSDMLDAPSDLPSTADTDHYWSQANLVIVDPETVIKNVLEREYKELSAKLANDIENSDPDACFIDEALNWHGKRLERLRRMEKTNEIRTGARSVPLRQVSSQTEAKPSKSYLFYQCLDGQHIYLNPFSTKILCQEYQNLENCPLEIRAKILQMDWISMSDAWRKRFRYLEHLPLTCEFRLLEIDFEKSNLISKQTYELFQDQIKMREKERERRRREERKREKIIQVEQNRKIYGIQPSLKINLDNPDQFPSVSDERYLGLSQPRNRTTTDDYLSSDFEELGDENVANNVANPPPEEPIPSTNIADSDSSTDVASGLALSFKDIQLQEAAKAAKVLGTKEPSRKPAAGAWSTKQSSSSGAQSSFAQLLVDAKSSKKEWTRNVNSDKSASSISNVGSSHRQNPNVDSDDGGEELRAPPCDFTLSDFIDMNVVSGKKKGKSKRAG